MERLNSSPQSTSHQLNSSSQAPVSTQRPGPLATLSERLVQLARGHHQTLKHPSRERGADIRACQKGLEALIINAPAHKRLALLIGYFSAFDRAPEDYAKSLAVLIRHCAEDEFGRQMEMADLTATARSFKQLVFDLNELKGLLSVNLAGLARSNKPLPNWLIDVVFNSHGSPEDQLTIFLMQRPHKEYPRLALWIERVFQQGGLWQCPMRPFHSLARAALLRKTAPPPLQALDQLDAHVQALPHANSLNSFPNPPAVNWSQVCLATRQSLVSREIFRKVGRTLQAIVDHCRSIASRRDAPLSERHGALRLGIQYTQIRYQLLVEQGVRQRGIDPFAVQLGLYRELVRWQQIKRGFEPGSFIFQNELKGTLQALLARATPAQGRELYTLLVREAQWTQLEQLAHQVTLLRSLETKLTDPAQKATIRGLIKGRVQRDRPSVEAYLTYLHESQLTTSAHVLVQNLDALRPIKKQQALEIVLSAASTALQSQEASEEKAARELLVEHDYLWQVRDSSQRPKLEDALIACSASKKLGPAAFFRLLSDRLSIGQPTNPDAWGRVALALPDMGGAGSSRSLNHIGQLIKIVEPSLAWDLAWKHRGQCPKEIQLNQLGRALCIAGIDLPRLSQYLSIQDLSIDSQIAGGIVTALTTSHPKFKLKNRLGLLRKLVPFVEQKKTLGNALIQMAQSELSALPILFAIEHEISLPQARLSPMASDLVHGVISNGGKKQLSRLLKGYPDWLKHLPVHLPTHPATGASQWIAALDAKQQPVAAQELLKHVLEHPSTSKALVVTTFHVLADVTISDSHGRLGQLAERHPTAYRKGLQEIGALEDCVALDRFSHLIDPIRSSQAIETVIAQGLRKGQKAAHLQALSHIEKAPKPNRQQAERWLGWLTQIPLKSGKSALPKRLRLTHACLSGAKGLPEGIKSHLSTLLATARKEKGPHEQQRLQLYQLAVTKGLMKPLVNPRPFLDAVRFNLGYSVSSNLLSKLLDQDLETLSHEKQQEVAKNATLCLGKGVSSGSTARLVIKLTQSPLKPLLEQQPAWADCCLQSICYEIKRGNLRLAEALFAKIQRDLPPAKTNAIAVALSARNQHWGRFKKQFKASPLDSKLWVQLIHTSRLETYLNRLQKLATRFDPETESEPFQRLVSDLLGPLRLPKGLGKSKNNRVQARVITQLLEAATHLDLRRLTPTVLRGCRALELAATTVKGDKRLVERFPTEERRRFYIASAQLSTHATTTQALSTGWENLLQAMQQKLVSPEQAMELLTAIYRRANTLYGQLKEEERPALALSLGLWALDEQKLSLLKAPTSELILTRGKAQWKAWNDPCGDGVTDQMLATGIAQLYPLFQQGREVELAVEETCEIFLRAYAKLHRVPTGLDQERDCCYRFITQALGVNDWSSTMQRMILEKWVVPSAEAQRPAEILTAINLMAILSRHVPEMNGYAATN